MDLVFLYIYVELSGIEPELANENDKAFVLKSLINNSNKQRN